MADFEDIKITGFDDAASGPSGEGVLMRMVLRLSNPAPNVWCSYFNTGWENNFFMTKRRAVASYNTITVTCLADELQGQINEMKNIIRQTNIAYRELLDEAAAKLAESEAEKNRQREALSNLKGKLNFD